MEELLLKYNLQYFAEGEGGEKTEDATAKKLEKAREEGQVAKSNELVVGATLLLLFIALKVFVGTVGDGFIEAYKVNYNYISNYANNSFGDNTAYSIVGGALWDIFFIALPFYIVSLIAGIGVNVGQISWKVTTKPLMPKLDRLDPISGFKRMFSKDKLVELLKSVLKVTIITYVVYTTLKDSVDLLLAFYQYTLWEALVIVGDIVISLGIKISALLLILGVFYHYIKNLSSK